MLFFVTLAELLVLRHFGVDHRPRPTSRGRGDVGRDSSRSSAHGRLQFLDRGGQTADEPRSMPFEESELNRFLTT